MSPQRPQIVGNKYKKLKMYETRLECFEINVKFERTIERNC